MMGLRSHILQKSLDILLRTFEQTVFAEWQGKDQQYKGITIYSRDKDNFTAVVADLDWALRKYKLLGGTILGDKRIGISGRIFYRYDANTKALADKSYYTDDHDGMAEYAKHYEANRKDGGHLASDMTAEDDIGSGENFAKAMFKRVDEMLEQATKVVQSLEEQRRELINFLDLNKGSK